MRRLQLNPSTGKFQVKVIDPEFDFEPIDIGPSVEFKIKSFNDKAVAFKGKHRVESYDPEDLVFKSIQGTKSTPDRVTMWGTEFVVDIKGEELTFFVENRSQELISYLESKKGQTVSLTSRKLSINRFTWYVPDHE